jgi:hypothetical protein
MPTLRREHQRPVGHFAGAPGRGVTCSFGPSSIATSRKGIQVDVVCVDVKPDHKQHRPPFRQLSIAARGRTLYETREAASGNCKQQL